MNLFSKPVDAIVGSPVLYLTAVAAGCFALARLTRRKSDLPLPPGPRPLPFVGNILDVPQTSSWKTFSEWSQKWGDLVSISIFGQPVILVSSAKVVEDLLEKRSLIYSNRPALVFAGEIVGWSNAIGLLQYGHRFREFRKYMSRLIGTKAAMERFNPLMEHETEKFLVRVLADPNSFSDQIRRTAGALILMLAYGYPVGPGKDSLVELVDTAVHQFGQGTEPGAFLVDVFPVLKRVPAWFPGAGWKQTGEIFRQTLNDMADVPFRFVREQMAAGTAVPSYTSELLSGEDLDPETEWNVKWSAASLYAGGGDATVSFLHTFFLVMQLYPQVQRKAQEELDRVVGTDRLPRIADRPNLPYIEAVIKELLRWNPVSPLGIPHATAEDDVYEGYSIPKGSTVIVNIWHILSDPSVYPNPTEFNPERFLGENPQKDPSPIAFGFGRRVCPGINMAYSSVFIEIAMTLAVFNISKYVDETGNVVEPEIHYSDGTVSHPKPFKCDIKSRSEKATDLVSAIEL